MCNVRKPAVTRPWGDKVRDKEYRGVFVPVKVGETKIERAFVLNTKERAQTRRKGLVYWKIKIHDYSSETLARLLADEVLVSFGSAELDVRLTPLGVRSLSGAGGLPFKPPLALLGEESMVRDPESSSSA